MARRDPLGVIQLGLVQGKHSGQLWLPVLGCTWEALRPGDMMRDSTLNLRLKTVGSSLAVSLPRHTALDEIPTFIQASVFLLKKEESRD